jgi:hypothetical protein
MAGLKSQRRDDYLLIRVVGLHMEIGNLAY